MYSIDDIVYNGPVITLVLIRLNRSVFDEDMREKNDFYIFVPTNLFNL